jgi:hypothetical protein
VLDALESFVDPRVLADFQDLRVSRRVLCEGPMGLQRLREKIRAKAYEGDIAEGWLVDVSCIFGRFEDDSLGSVRIHMANALHWLFNALFIQFYCDQWTSSTAKLTYWKAKVKELEDEYIADQEERAAAARARPSSAAAAAAAAPVPNAPMAANHPTAAMQSATAASVGDASLSAAIASAAAASSVSRPTIVSPRGAGDEQAERKEKAAHPPAVSAAAALATSPSYTAAAAAAHLSQRAVVPAAASVGASTVAAAADASSVVPAGKAAGLAASLRPLVDHAEQLERHNAQLLRQLAVCTAELESMQKQAAGAANQAERLIVVKREKFDVVADAHGASQQAAKAVEGKRKANEELESEAKRRRAAEAGREELTKRNKQLQSALLVNPKARPDCSSCFESPTSAVCLPCGHLVSCIDCAEQWQANHHTCPVCRRAVAQVVQTYLASGSQ